MSTQRAAHRDPNRLKSMYHGEQMTISEIADRLDVTWQTVWRNMKEQGIRRRPPGTCRPGASYKNEEDLRRLYWQEGKSLQGISRMFDVSSTTIEYWMEKHGIDRRSNGAAASEGDNGAHLEDEEQPDRDLLYRLYVKEELGSEAIARRLNISRTTVLRRLRDHGIEVRGRGERNPSAPWKDEENLREMYHEQEMSVYDIADTFDVDVNTITYWMDKLGVNGGEDDGC